MLFLHLRLIQSALGQKAEAKPVGSSHRERSQRWAEMPNDEVASLSGWAGSPLGQSPSQERASHSRVKFGLPALLKADRVIAQAVSDAPWTLVLQAITSDIQHVPLTDEVPRRLVPPGQVSPGYKSETKGPGYASEAGRVSPQPRLKGCQQRQSRGRHLGGACLERQNLRMPPMPLRSMRSVSSAPAATKWPGGTSSCQRVDPLSNSPLQPKRSWRRFLNVWRNQHGFVSHCQN